jgi:threonine aldolase
MNAEALVLFDRALADKLRHERKRAGHLQSKGRFLAAQLLALLEGERWRENARAANQAAQEIARACGGRLLQPVEANEIFLRLSAAEAAALRSQGLSFYDWGAPDAGGGAARLVTAWNSDARDVAALARAIASL